MVLDASLSYDEALVTDPSVNNDPLLNFTWLCPKQISNFCKDIKSKILKIPPDTLSLLRENSTNSSILTNFIFGLILSKQSRSVSTNFTVTISKEIKSNSDYLIILPSSLGLKNEDVLFCSKFIDTTIDPLSFSYLWTVGENDSTFDSYKNGRNQNCLLISPKDLSIGRNSIKVQVSSSTTILEKNYFFTRSVPPSGGSCSVVAINSGNSSVTNFKFSAEKWTTKNPPLLYKFFYYNSLNLTIDVNKYSDIPLYTNTFISPGKEFHVSVMDLIGLSTTFLCNYTQTNTNKVNGTVGNSTSALDFLNNNSTNKLQVFTLII
jgi:hypothetical protein